jgi:autotransporter-associated beta strand protein
MAPTTANSNITIVGLTRGPGVGTINSGAAGAWGGNGWDGTATLADAITRGDFATFTMTANAGYAMSLQSFDAYNVRRSSSGPTTGQWQYQLGASGTFADIGSPITWGSTTTAAGNAQAAITLSGISSLQNIAAGTTVTFRIVNYGASSSGGTWYLNDPSKTTALDFTVNGTITPVGSGADLFWNGAGGWGSSSPGSGGDGSWADGTGAWDPTKTANFGGTAGTVTISGAASAGNGLAFNAVSAGSYTITGGVLNMSGSTNRITVSTGGTAAIASVISGTAGVAKEGSGLLALSGTNTFSGGLAVNGGTLVVGSDEALGVADGAISFANNGAIRFTQSVALGSRALSGNATFDVAAGQQVTGSGDVNLSALALSNSGTVTLTNANAKSIGSIALSAPGTLDASTGGQLSLTSGISATYASGTGQVVGNVNFGTGAGSISVADGGTLLLTGQLINNSGTTVRSVSKTGAGTLVLDGDNSSTLGRIQLGSAVTTNGGTLRISNGGALGTNEMYFNYGTLDATAPVTIGSSFFGALSGGFSIGGREATRARITGSDVDVAGNVTAYSTVGTGDIVLEVNNRTTFSGAATLATTAGMTGFKVAGSGTLRLTGDMAGLTAPVNVAESATLSVETSLAASSLVSVAGTATLTGNSSVGPLAVNAGGRLAPGLGGVGTINAGNTTFGPGGNYTLQVSDATGGAGTGWDFLNVSGSLTIASTEASPFNINLWSLAGSTSGSAANFVPGDSYTWKIATASSGLSGFAGGKFAINTAAINGSDGFANALAGGSFKATNTGNDLNVVFTPFTAGVSLTWFGNGATAGGSGTWSALGSNWSDGSSVGTWDPARTAIFNATSGTVTVAAGGITASRGLQFDTSGYRVSGGAITLGGTSADTNAISVALSSTATIDSVLAGSNGVAKTGFGTLVLAGSNTVAGGVQVREGTLQVGAGGTAGALAGDVSIDSGATLAFNKSSNDTVGATLSGAGAVVQRGSGDLRLTGANSGLSGGVRAEAGSVTVGASGALGTGATTVSAGSLYVESGVTNAAPILVQSTADVTPFTALYWDFGSGTTPSAQPLSGVPAGLTVGDLTRINTGTTDPLLSTTSQSSGYAGASGSYNAGLVAGRTLTVISGSTPAFEFALTPQAGSRVDVTSVSFGSRSTTTGPWSYELRSSADGYTAAVATWTSTGTAGYADSTWRLLSGSSFAVGSGDGATVTYRLFGIGNTGTNSIGGVNWRIDDLTLGGRMVTGSGASIAIGTQSTAGTALFTGQMTLERTVPLTAPTGGTARFEGAIVDGIGANGIQKIGGGTVVLAGNNTYRGTTTIAAGTLEVTGNTSSSPFVIESGATLAGNGTVGSITTAAGATLAPGVGIGTLSAGNTALAGGAALNWQLYNAGGASPAGNWDLLGVTGGITVNATSGSPFAINLLSASDAAGTAGNAINFDHTVPGRWTFATTTSGVTGFDATKFSLSTAGFTNTLSGGTFSVGLSLDSLGLDIIFTPSSAFSSLVWYGDDETAGGKGAWTDLNVNWFNENTSTVTTWSPAKTALFNTVGGEVTIGPGGISAANGLTFAANDYVLAGGALTLSGTSLAANTVTVDPGISTTLAAPVAGTAGMTKAGAGTLVLDGSNTLSGGVTVAGGTLQIGAGGTGGTLATDVVVGTGATLAFNRADTSTFSGAVSGLGGLVKTGAGTLALTGSSSFSGGTTVQEGTVVVGDGATAGAILSTGNLDLAAGTVLAFDRSDAVSFNGAVNNAGTLAQRGSGVLTLSRTGTANAYGNAFTLRVEDGTVDLFRNNESLVGILGPGNTVELAGGTLQLSSNAGEETKFQGAAIDVQQSSVLAILRTGTTPTNHTTTGFSAPITVRNGSTLTFDYRGAIGSSGTFTAKGTTTYSSGVTLASNATFAVTNSAGGTAEVIFSGDVVESGGSFGLTKTGDQRLTLTGSANTYSGATTVAVGTLALGSNALLPNSPSITIAAGATLDVSAKASGYAVAVGQTVGGAGTVAGGLIVGTGATLAPGASPGTLSVTQGVTWASGGNYNWEIVDAAGTAGSPSGWDLVNVGGALTIGANSSSPFVLNLWSLSGGTTSGAAINFDATQQFTWKIASAAGGITGFAADAFTINTAPANGTGGFANSLAGGSFSVAQSGSDLNLVFTPASTPGAVREWYGDGLTPGKGGTWTAADNRWSNGSTVGPWSPSYRGQFGGEGGTVDIQGGGVTASAGLEFTGDGYTVTGQTLTLGGTTTADNEISVATSTIATLSAPVQATQGLQKTGAGSLVLGGVVTAPGGLDVAEGVVAIGAGGTAGSVVGNISVAAGARLAFDRSDDTTFAGDLAGAGDVEQLGTGTLRLSGSGGHTGSTSVRSGKLLLENPSALASSPTTVDAGATLAMGPQVSAAVPTLTNDGLVDVGFGELTVVSGLTAEGLKAQIVAGRNEGEWNGATGITSSGAAGTADRAVGWIDNGDGSFRFGFAAAGDLDMNGLVDLDDVIAFVGGGLYDTGSPAVWAQGDYDYNGIVDLDDVIAFVGGGLYDKGPYNTGIEPGSLATLIRGNALPMSFDGGADPNLLAGGMTAVPEPSAGMLLALAVGGLVAYNRRRRICG